MKLTLTIVLLALCGVLATYVFWSENSQPDPLKEKLAEETALQFDPAQVDALTVRLAESEVLLQKDKKTGLWRMMRPQEDRADQTKVEELVAALAELPVLDRFSSSEAEKGRLEAKYVIGPTVNLWAGARKLGEIVVGQSGVYENSNYALVGQGAEDHDVLLVARKLTAMVPVNPSSWRDSKLADLPAREARLFRVVSEMGEVEFVRESENAPWHFAKPMTTAANSRMISDIVDLIAEVKIVSFLDQHAPELGVKAAGSYTIGSDKAQITVQLYPDPDTPPPAPPGLSSPAGVDTAAPVLATCSDRKGLFRVPGDLMNLTRLQPNQLRDRRLAHLTSKRINALDIAPAGGASISLRRPGEAWLLKTGPQAFVPGNSSRVSDLIRRLNEAQIRDFVSDSLGNLEKFGLKNPALTLTFKTVGFEGDAESNLKEKELKREVLRFGRGEGGGLYANWEGEPFVYLVEDALESAVSPDFLHWRSPSLLQLSTLALRELKFQVQGRPDFVMTFDPSALVWSATRDGKDVSSMLNLVEVDEMASRLATLTANEWVGNAAEARAKLASATQTISILAAMADPKDPLATVPMRTTLRIVPINPNMTENDGSLYYGSLDGVPDIFYLTGAQVKDLNPNSLFSARAVERPTQDLPPLTAPPANP